MKSDNLLVYQVFYKKGVVKNLAKFTRKHLCWSFISEKLDKQLHL